MVEALLTGSGPSSRKSIIFYLLFSLVLMPRSNVRHDCLHCIDVTALISAKSHVFVMRLSFKQKIADLFIIHVWIFTK